jgi:hypothetical protein
LSPGRRAATGAPRTLVIWRCGGISQVREGGPPAAAESPHSPACLILVSPLISA